MGSQLPVSSEELRGRGRAVLRGGKVKSFILSYEGSFQLRLQRKLAGIEPAELLSETVHRFHGIHSVSRGLGVFFVAAIITLIILGIAYIIVSPLVISWLPSLTLSPRAVLGTYKRTVTGVIDYFPTVSNGKNATLADIGHGSSFSFVSSATIVPLDGLEGVFRMEIDNPNERVENPDLDVAFRVIWQSTTGAKVASYLLFSRWPELFNAVIPVNIVSGRWLAYDLGRGSTEFTSMRYALSFLSSNRQFGQSRLIEKLWQHALKANAIQWQVERVTRHDDLDDWIIDISFAIEQKNLLALATALKGDATFEDPLAASAARGQGTITLVSLIESLRSGSGTLRIGVTRRIIYDAQWEFDLFHRDIGTMRGDIMTRATPLSRQGLIRPPNDTQDILTLIAIAALMNTADAAEPSGGTVITSDGIDSDADGL